MGRSLRIERIDVTPDALDVLVRVTSRDKRKTTFVPSETFDELAEVLPGLSRHRCDSGSAHGILAELRDTETPHVLEHITLELMASAGSPRTLSGRTRWDFRSDGDGVFHVSVEYDDDAVAMGALKYAGEIVAWLLGEAEKPDVDAAVAHLRDIRSR